jgi:radical SAM superfamily enzyme YgiQ (UPF0313 family)
MYNFCLVQLTPRDMRSQETVNMGLEIIKAKIIEQGWNVTLVKFGEQIDPSKYDIIGFNIFYITQQLNLVPFLQYTGIDVMENPPLLIAGGSGVQNPRPISRFIDIFVIGDGETLIVEILKAYSNGTLETLEQRTGIYIPGKTSAISFARTMEINSFPVVYHNRGMLEITRGCKHRCKFCQYSWTSGVYREKPLDLLKEQIMWLKSQGVKAINLMSCNIGGYSKIIELLEFCIEQELTLVNSDVRVDEYSPRVAQLLYDLKIRSIRVGVESFTESVRFNVNKRITDEQLDDWFDLAIQYNSSIHFYLIFGLPGETDYQAWFDWIKNAKEKISKITDRNIRIDYSITNFEPSIFTPFENSEQVNFIDKEIFLKKYLKTLEEVGDFPDASKKWYHNMHGRIGRREESYNILMWLMNGDESIADVLLKANIKGITRSIKPPVYRKLKKAGAKI